MIPSLVKRISRSLNIHLSTSNNTTDGAGPLQASDSAASGDGNLQILRRQSTKELISMDESSFKSKVTSRSSITSVRSSSIIGEVPRAKTMKSTPGNSRQASRRLSKPPSRLVEQDDMYPIGEGSLAKSSSRSMSKSPSRQPTKKNSRQPSLSKAASNQGSISKTLSQQSGLSKVPSLSRSGSKSKSSVTKKTSVPAATPGPAKKPKPGGKLLWFPTGAYLTVRNEEGGFYLCRAVNNIYNTTKLAKVRWLGPKTGRKKKRGRRGRTSKPAAPIDKNAFELMYADVLDPTTVLMEVAVERQGTTFWLNKEDEKETDRLMQVAEDVESGKIDKADVGDDVEEVIQVDYEPPVKRRKLQTGTSPMLKTKTSKTTGAEKKPRLKKTASQKERDKTQKAKEREEKKQKKKEAVAERKRKLAKSDKDTTLHPDPSVKVMEKDPLWETTIHMPYVSKFANSKLAFRAVQLTDTKMLKKLLKDADRIRSLGHKRSTLVRETPLEFAMKQGNMEAMDLLIEDAFGTKFQARLNEAHPDRVLIEKLGTGSYNFRSLGVGRIRPLMASRGAREGNNALIKDQADMSVHYTDSDSFLESAMVAGASKELLIRILNNWETPKGESYEFDSSTMNKFLKNMPTMLARGFNKTAGEILKILQHTCGRYCHHMPGSAWKVLVAKDVAELPSIPPSAINLNIKMIKGFTMIHLAASNPNPHVLEKVLNSDPNFLVSDVKGIRPVHIAAGCSSPATLQLLLDKGANPYDTDTEGETALHFAIRAGRTKNVNILLNLITDSGSHFMDPTAGKPNGGVNRANKQSLSPLHIACQLADLDIVKLLVKHGANLDAKTSINALSMTPLMYAAGMGHLGIVHCLVNAGATVEFRDRVGRTPLMHAAMNGSTSVMSYLLNIGASPSRKDTSGNTPMHYAAAYGWYFSVKLLLQLGAHPDVSNDWTTTPLSVACLKGHQGIVSLLLDDDRVNINFPNEKGETLLFLACSSEKEKDLVEQIRYLVKEKGADCSLVDSSGNTPLHNLASAEVHKLETHEEDGKTITTNMIVDDEVSKVILEIAKLMVDNGCDITKRNKNGFTPAMTALKMKNIQLAQYLVEKGSPIFPSLKQEENDMPDTLLHHVAETLLQVQSGDPNSVIIFLTKTWTVNGEKRTFIKELCEMAQTYNGNGNTPLLSACDVYSRTSFYEVAHTIQLAAVQWGNAHTFLKNLVLIAKSNLNAANKPKWIKFQPETDENEKTAYRNPDQAKWTPVFYMVQANDPFFTNHKKYDAAVKGTGLQYFLGLGADVNIYDLNKNTPLTLALEQRKGPAILKMLIADGGADVNLCKQQAVMENNKMVTYMVAPICLAAQRGLWSELEELVRQKADVNAVDGQSQASVLHILASQRNPATTLSSLMEKLLEAGADLNALNKDERTPLHLLINGNAGRIDDSFEEEITLIGKKANLTIRDCLGRIPLHYVFTKAGQENEKSQFDPVDLCKLLVKSMKAADLNITDTAGCTPLHYAARRGSSICCVYLIQKGAQLDVKDNNGNTPLSIAVQAGHDSCGCALIQQGADLLSPAVQVQESSGKEEKKEEQPAEWQWKPIVKVKAAEDKKEIPLFQEAIKQGLVGTAFLILEWPVEKSGVTLVDAIEMAVKNSQFNVALRLLSTTIKGSAEVCAVREKNRNLLHVLALSAEPSNNSAQQEKVAQFLLDRGVSAIAKDLYNCTPLFYAAYKKNFLLANFFADLPGVLNVKSVDSFGRNLVATSLWKHFFTGLPSNLWDWLEKLLKKKVDINKRFDYPLLTDVFGTKAIRNGGLQDPEYWQSYPDYQTTPLIFALHCQDFTFTHNLLQWGANPNLPDTKMLTPLMHAVKLSSVKHVKQLLKYNYDPQVDDKEPTEATPKKVQKKKKPVHKGNVFRLKKMVSDVTNTDSESSEEEEEEKQAKQKKEKVYFPVKKTSSVNLNATDSHGWTALHYAAAPLELGTFDNDELVFVLGKAGAKLDIRNSAGETPLDLALANCAPRVAAMLQTLMGVDKKYQKQPVMKPADRHVDDGVPKRADYDFHADADKQLGGGEEGMEEEEEAFEPEVNPCCIAAKAQGQIVRDEEQDLPYEVLMTKCDAHLGVWGLYNFYQIQLVHQPGQNLYVLFTRWGRIGDTGQYQNTPFTNRADAVKEFCKIFRQKSGNKWEDVKSFEQKPKKYRLVPGEERKPPSKQKGIKFDFSTPVKCSLPDDIHKAMKIMVNLEKQQDSYRRDIAVDTDVLPFGRFDRNRLIQAKQLLDKIGLLVADIMEYRENLQAKSEEEKQQHQEDCQKVSELSSDYFQLIPQKNFVYEQLRPLDTSESYRGQVRLLTNLLDFEVTTKMMLGAMYRKSVVHPLDYIYQSMKCKLELMEEDDPMTQYILRYAYAGCNGEQRFEGVYKVQREGEEARFLKSGIGNRRFLWHGTSITNLVSILNRGLIVTPLDVSRTGERFGKGIYFADSFDKSGLYSYTSYESSNIMLLCEVALGKQRIVTNSNDSEKRTAAHNSSIGLGRNLPDPKYDVCLPSGETMPLGDKITDFYYTTESGEERYKPSDFNEFIIYEENQVCIRYLVQYRRK